MSPGTTLLLVDDDDAFRERMARALARLGFEVRTANGPAAALVLAREEAPECAVVDLRMPGGGGLELLAALKALEPATRVLVLTGYGSIPTAIEATRAGATGYLQKPVDAEDVARALLGEGPAAGPPVETPSLARAEWEHIQRVLSDCGGNVSEAARLLGLHRRSLQRKLQKYAPPR